MAAAAPIAMALGGALYSFLQKPAELRAKRIAEYKDYAGDFPGLAQRRLAGANLFDTLGQDRAPEDLLSAFQTAASGMHANTEPAAWNLSHRPRTTEIKPLDLSAWQQASPTLGAENAAAFLNLFDKSEQGGLDPGGKTGDWNLNPAGYAASGESGHGPDDANRSGDDYRTKIGYNNQAQIDPVTGQWIGGARGQTQEAQDLGNAVAGLGQSLGIDWTKRGPGDYQNFDPEQLAGYGFTPGNYGPAALNYLRSFDPTVTQNPNWGPLVQSLGDPSSLGVLNLTPRAPVTYAANPQPIETLGAGGE
jgi:hypothetical protein